MGEFLPYFTYRKKSKDGRVKELVCGFVEDEYGETKELLCKVVVDDEEVGRVRMYADEDRGIIVEEEGLDEIDDGDILDKIRDVKFWYKTKRAV